jgi:hypothetical protein
MNQSSGMWWSAFGEAADTFPTASVAVRLKPVVPAVNRQHGVGSHTNLWLTPFRLLDPAAALKKFWILYWSANRTCAFIWPNHAF